MEKTFDEKIEDNHKMAAIYGERARILHELDLTKLPPGMWEYLRDIISPKD